MVAGLDSWQAMELDIALAVKYSTLERESEHQMLEVIVSAIDNVVRAQGGKIKKRKPRASLIVPYTEEGLEKANDDLPNVNDLIKALGGGETFVNSNPPSIS